LLDREDRSGHRCAGRGRLLHLVAGEGYEVAEHPLADWPQWLLQEALREPRLQVSLSKSLSHPHDVVVLDRTEALRKLDPCLWNGKHDEWFELLMGCKAAGIDCEDFVEWSIGDPDYADDAHSVRVKWNSIEPKHAGAFFAALKAQGIKLHQHRQTHQNRHRLAEVHHSAPSAPSREKVRPPANLHSRTRGLTNWLRSRQSEPNLFKVAVAFADELCLTEPVAQHLLAADFPELRKALGEKCFRRTIANAFDHIQSKIKDTA
jgi:hypothetical protein